MPTLIPSFDEAAILVEVRQVLGSTPREAGAFMLVGATRTWGTIGGGNMEFEAVAEARRMLAGTSRGGSLEIVLGPETDQCCGGRVPLELQAATPAERARLEVRLREEEDAQPDVYLFGAGHVGRALAEALSPLPFRVTVVETREPELDGLPAGATRRLTPMPEAEVAGIRAGGAAVVLTHDHGLDFLIAAEALRRRDLAYVGMIGSRTKRAVFASWLRDQGAVDLDLGRLVLPIGGHAVADKRPAVIAALVAAELLVTLAGAKRAP